MNEVFFTFDKGVVTSSPEISSQEIFFSKVENFVPIFNRFYSLRSHKTYTSTLGPVRAIVGFFELGQGLRRYFYITDTNVYTFPVGLDPKNLTIDGLILTIDGSRLVIDQPNPIDLGSFNSTTTEIISWGAWDDTSSIYFSRTGTPLTKLQNNVVSEVPATWSDGIGVRKLSAKYTLVHENRLFIANIQTDNGDNYYRRVQWSDLYNPEDFEIDRAKEGDFFDLENNNLDITGLHSHRGFLLLFTRQSIWRAQYIGFSKLFQFQPVRSGIGNIFHHSSISVKDIVYFIGDDNFYALDGFNVVPIGSDVWNTYLEEREDSITDEVLSFSDPFNSEIMWKFKRKGNSSYTDYRQNTHDWLIVYNYKEGRWSFRSADGITCYSASPYKVTATLPADFITTLSDDDDRLSDGDWQFQELPTNILVGQQNSVSLYRTGSFTDFNGAFLVGEAETHEMFFGSLKDSKEVSEVKLSYSSVGSPVINLSVGTRNNQTQSFTWSQDFLEEVITTENEKRFLLDNSGLRGKFFKFRLTVTNTDTDYVEELNGGSIELSGMQSSGSEI